MADADSPAAEATPDADADLAPIENPAADIAAASEAASAEETATTEGKAGPELWSRLPLTASFLHGATAPDWYRLLGCSR